MLWLPLLLAHAAPALHSTTQYIFDAPRLPSISPIYLSADPYIVEEGGGIWQTVAVYRRRAMGPFSHPQSQLLAHIKDNSTSTVQMTVGAVEGRLC